MDEIPKFNIKITEDNLYESSLELIQKIRPNWPIDQINFKIFTDGITNRLLGVYRQQHPDNNKYRDMVLIRIYGENTDLFIDRQTECTTMRIMYKHGLAAPIYGTFLNGICYGFTPGKVLNEKLVRDENISMLIAETMAQMHTLRPLIKKSSASSSKLASSSESSMTTINQNLEACLFPSLKKFVALIDSDLSLKLPTNKRFKNFCDIDKLNLEIKFLENLLKNLQSPIVFCHNDLLLKNILYDENLNKVTFIDFDYSDYNYQAFDIANHFCEFCGMDSFDYNLYPDKNFQLRWLEIYLKKWYSLTSLNANNNNNNNNIDNVIVDNDNVENLYEIVNKFSLASCLFWGTWALVQASNSSIDFDYISFACQRLGEYFRRKNELKF